MTCIIEALRLWKVERADRAARDELLYLAAGQV